MNVRVELTTARLLLRRPRSSDVKDIFEHQSIQENAFLDFSTDEWERWPAGPYLIESRRSGELLGGTGLGFQTAGEAETGYVLARDAWGHGSATEALAAIVDALGVWAWPG